MPRNSGLIYDVETDLNPSQLTRVGREIMALWVAFALGHEQLDGKMLHHPTGRYASSIQFRQIGFARVMVMANTGIAPEALTIERGHQAINMLQHLAWGRLYPMHRGTQFAYVGGGARGRRMWAQARETGFNGFARTPYDGTARGANTSGTGPAWTVPAMPAYSPAKILADLVRETYGVEVR